MRFQTTETHVDDWLDLPPIDEPERLAKEWLERFMSGIPDGLSVEEMSAWMQEKSMWLAARPLFCTYRGEVYRVAGASRLGDVWLNRDPNKNWGHDLRVDVTECSEWEMKHA